jgi:NAD+ synthase
MKIQQFISTYVSESHTKGLVIGLSGGLDSSVVLKLSANALGSSRLIALIMPSDITPKEDIEHAVDYAKSLGVEYHTIDIVPIINKYEEILPANKRVRGNLTARIRMNILYYHAALNGYLVAGTSDKSEVELGYFTKFGDGAADMMPIAGLYKTQVRALAKFLGLPSSIINKKSSPRLWDNHLAEEEIGMDYEMIDQILYLLIDRKAKPKDVIKRLIIASDQVKKIKEMMEKSSHKRNAPPFPAI